MRERDGLLDRIATIADEACGLGPVETPDESLTRIERELFRLRKEADDLRAENSALTRELAELIGVDP